MLWLIQSDFPKMAVIDRITGALALHGIPYALVEVKPDGWEAAADALAAGRDDVCTYGTIRLMRHAQANWQPGVFLNGNFSFDACLAGWGAEMLNADAVVTRLGDAAFDGPMFVRPHEEGKLFAGEIVEGRRLPFWRERHITGNPRLSADTLVVVAPLRDIDSETRCFVVDGVVVQASRYVSGYRKDEGPPDPGAVAYASRMVDRWRPHDNFVVDIASTEGGYRIVEVNCINTSGLYTCDAEPVFTGLTRYVERMSSQPARSDIVPATEVKP